MDYERSNFSVSQAKFEDSSQQQLTPIKALNATLTKTSTGNSGTSKGTTAGIAIGVVLFVLICVSAVVAFFIIKRKRDRRRKEADEAKTTTSSEEDPAEKVRQGFAKAELGTDNENVRHEVAGDEAFQERAEIETPPTAGWVADKARHPGSKTDVAEMNGGDVSRAELSESGKPPAHEMYDPSIPAVELPAETPQELQGSVPSLAGALNSRALAAGRGQGQGMALRQNHHHYGNQPSSVQQTASKGEFPGRDTRP